MKNATPPPLPPLLAHEGTGALTPRVNEISRALELARLAHECGEPHMVAYHLGAVCVIARQIERLSIAHVNALQTAHDVRR